MFLCEGPVPQAKCIDLGVGHPKLVTLKGFSWLILAYQPIWYFLVNLRSSPTQKTCFRSVGTASEHTQNLRLLQKLATRLHQKWVFLEIISLQNSLRASTYNNYQME